MSREPRAGVGYPPLTMTSLAGQFLIAVRSLQDPNFARSVTLLIQHNHEGAMGLVVNQPTPITMHEVWAQLLEAAAESDEVDMSGGGGGGGGATLGDCERDEALFRGGPCPGPLMVLHTDDRYGGTTPAELMGEAEQGAGGLADALPGLFLTMDRDMIGLLVRSDAAPVRFITGYAGWGPGQLEAEFAIGSWRALPATLDAVLGDPESLWDDLTRRHMAELIGGVNPDIIPADPSSN